MVASEILYIPFVRYVRADVTEVNVELVDIIEGTRAFGFFTRLYADFVRENGAPDDGAIGTKER